MAVALLTPQPRSQWLDNNGDPLANGRLFFFVAGSQTAKAVFSDFEALTPLTQPAITGPDGRLTYRLLQDELYDIRVEDSLGNLLYTEQSIGSDAEVANIFSLNRVGNQATVRLTANAGDPVMTATAIFPIGSIPVGGLIFVETSFGNGQGLTGFNIGTSVVEGAYGQDISRLAPTTTTPSDYRNYSPAPVPSATNGIVRAVTGPYDGTGSLLFTAFWEEQTAVVTL